MWRQEYMPIDSYRRTYAHLTIYDANNGYESESINSSGYYGTNTAYCPECPIGTWVSKKIKIL
jgi:hypothetical protein